MSQALTMTVEWVTAQATTTVAYEKVRQALADAHTYASDKLTPEQVVAAMGGENIMYNRSCSLPAAFIIPLYFLYGVVADQGAAAVTTPAVYSRVLRANMLVAGDTCSRAILLSWAPRRGVCRPPFTIPSTPPSRSRPKARRTSWRTLQ